MSRLSGSDGIGSRHVTTKEPEAPPPFIFRDGAIQTVLDLRVYRLTAIQKSAYRFAERCTAVLGSPEADRLPVRFVFGPTIIEQDALETARLFFQELLDQELREQVGDETRALRALIIAQAFSRTDLIRQD
ncbi:His-Xaa-Ser system protein HxsD [Myxococcus sp. CA051A]|uniref:His-Xaa-Ser system protein HxsD n=1 Tax=Myxococcus llanfairpwllgwyngyllgogerychwyrndrobwllllantysiliogogogochensis TaxID=2590453 RepID=A0A540WUF3_9BACT|nr:MULTISPECIES: His-Xaa-Ser system protein HxsD [unclassified Myxococcus]NTX37292.1 His-Xaa-Ser system protein HxsD [Myxococcus sp. CA033]NTX66160.1 His-Xaa-Ser system protein HxsD [Myxococcus sp. CA051A]TQF12626.1 His-Xaa-Ser system protein HxsD [Myxococcus llanfairpwllgwyngyllgogerychwyrndrobwllllantysiliogogogochensis]